MDALIRIPALAALLVLSLSSGCATFNEMKVPSGATHEDEVELAGKTLECAGVAHERVVWANLGATGIVIAVQATVSLGFPLVFGLGMQGGDPALVTAMLGVGYIGALGLGVTSLGLAGYALFEQYRASQYEQQAGKLLAGHPAMACFVTTDEPGAPSTPITPTPSTEPTSTDPTGAEDADAPNTADPAERTDRLP